MTVVNVRQLEPAMRNVIAALIHAEADANGDQEGLDFAQRIRTKAAEWDYENEMERRREALSIAAPDNPYVRDGLGGSSRRDAYLYHSAAWRRRSDLAHDLRTSNTDSRHHVPVTAKRRYQWAESAFRSGYLNAASFAQEARLFDDAVRAFSEYDRLVRQRFIDRPINTMADAAREERRLRRLATKGDYDRDRWLHVYRRRKEMEANENQWRIERRHRTETAFQRLKLREGRVTLSAMRALLRGVDPSPRRESRPAKTSPTS